jgi:ADP-heptose:LPS heptosyltransferase
MKPVLMKEVADDCRFFLGDRPCVWHKREGVVCTCERYEPIKERVLIIKLDAMGDVLRTTSLLPPLGAAHPGAAITWVTRAESVPLLENNPYLTEIVTYGIDTLVHLGARQFDRVINMDAGKISAGLASLARGVRTDGYVLHERGHVVATNPAAQAWLETGINDHLKRAGVRTYQQWMRDILEVPADVPDRYVLELRAEELDEGRRHLASLGLDFGRPVVGLNTGAGGRWELKQWREAGFLELMATLGAELGAQFVLLGGPGERERNARLQRGAPVPVIDPGCNNPVRHFAALTACCDVVVTGDTLAMHIALALGRRTVVLFGPTSAPEIELYGLGEKVVPDMTCLSCYKMTCDFVPNCMDLITTDMVAAAVRRQVAVARGAMASGVFNRC